MEMTDDSKEMIMEMTDDSKEMTDDSKEMIMEMTDNSKEMKMEMPDDSKEMIMEMTDDSKEMIILDDPAVATSSSKRKGKPQSGAAQEGKLKNNDYLKIRGGILKFDFEEIPDVTVTVGTRDINMINVSDEDLEYLSRTLEDAYSEAKNSSKAAKVRQSKYTNTFIINFNVAPILNELGIRDSDVIYKQNKLHLYSKGDVYQVGTDVPDVFGTLIVIFPVPHVGGELTFEDYVPESGLDKKSLRYIYFEGLKPSADEVKDGHRVTITCYLTNGEIQDRTPKLDVELSKIPAEMYNGFLETAKEFCKDKHNILFGNFKHRNDVFYDLVSDLKKDFEVIEVSVKEVDSPITECYVLKEYEFDFESLYTRELKTYDDIIGDKYRVDHILFTEDGHLENKSHRERATCGFRGNSPFSQTYTIEHYTAYLIKPVKEKKSNKTPTKVKEKPLKGGQTVKKSTSKKVGRKVLKK